MEFIEERAVKILKFEGEVVFEESNDLKEKAKKLLDERGINELIVDLSQVTFIDSSGVGMLISLFKNIREKQGRMVLTSPNEKVNRVLELTKMDMIIDIYENLDSAVSSFNES